MNAFKVTGRLARDARTSTAIDGSAWLFVEIGGTCNSLCVVARQNFGRGNTQAYIADKAARQLRQGSRVTVHAAGHDICYSPEPHLVLIGVDMIEQLDRVDHTAPRQAQRAALGSPALVKCTAATTLRCGAAAFSPARK